MHGRGKVHCPAGLAAVAALSVVLPGDVRGGLHGGGMECEDGRSTQEASGRERERESRMEKAREREKLMR